MTYDEAVYQAIQLGLREKRYASETRQNEKRRPGKSVVISGVEYPSATAAALAYHVDPVYVLRLARAAVKNPTGKKKDNSKRMGNTNRGTVVGIKSSDGNDEVFPSIKAFAKSRGYCLKAVYADYRNGMTFGEIDEKYRQILNSKDQMRIDDQHFNVDKDICDYLQMTRQTLYRMRKKGLGYQEIADIWRKHQSKHDDILYFEITDSLRLIHIIDFSQEKPDKAIALKETDRIYIICPECKCSHITSVRAIKRYAKEHHAPPICRACAVRKARGEDTLYHGMHFSSQNELLKRKGLEGQASRITSMIQNDTFEKAVDYLVEEKLRKEREKLRGCREEFDTIYDDGSKIIDYIDKEQCNAQGIDLVTVRVDTPLPLKCPKCGKSIKPVQLRYLTHRKPTCHSCDDQKKDLSVSSYDAVGYLVLAQKVPNEYRCEYQKEVRLQGNTCRVDIFVEANGLKAAVEIDGNRYHNADDDIKKTKVLLSDGCSVIRLREDNSDGTPAIDIPEAINCRIPNNPFRSKKNREAFAAALTKVLSLLGVQGQAITEEEVKEIKKKLPQNLTAERVVAAETKNE